MGRFCCVVGCSNRSGREKHLSYYVIPSVIKGKGEFTEKLSRERREQWIVNIKRDAVKNGDVKYPHVCSVHFHQGKPADLYDKSHPDWAPTKAMGHSSSSVSKAGSQSALKRFQRAKERSSKKRRCLGGLFENMDIKSVKVAEIDQEYESDKENENFEMPAAAEETRPVHAISIATQTDLSMHDIEELEKLKEPQDIGDSVLAKGWFEADNERVRFYTGLTTMTVLIAVFELISKGLPERTSLTKFQQLLMTIMRLRLNLSVQDLAYRFGVHASTVSRVFQTCPYHVYLHEVLSAVA